MEGIHDTGIKEKFLKLHGVRSRAAIAVLTELQISSSILGVASEMPHTVQLGHCALMGPENQWVVDVKCRPPNGHGIMSWESLSNVCSDAKVEVTNNVVTVTLPPLQEELEIVAFGTPGENDMKRMQLAVFGRKPRYRKEDWFVNVVLCDDTVTAFQKVRQEEEERGNKLLTARVGLFVANIEDDIKINLISLQPEWNFKGGEIMIKSRYAWWSQPTGFFRCRLPVGFPNVEKMEKFYLWGVTASHGADTATAELITVFEQSNGADGEVWENFKAKWIPNVASLLSWYAFLVLFGFVLVAAGFSQYIPVLYLFEAFWISMCAFRWGTKRINFETNDVLYLFEAFWISMCAFCWGSKRINLKKDIESNDCNNGSVSSRKKTVVSKQGFAVNRQDRVSKMVFCFALLVIGFTTHTSVTTECTVAREDPEVAMKEFRDSFTNWILSREFRNGDSGSVISQKERVVSKQGVTEGIANLTRKIVKNKCQKVLGQGHAVDWKEAHRRNDEKVGPYMGCVDQLKLQDTEPMFLRDAVIPWLPIIQKDAKKSGEILGNHSSQLRNERNERNDLQPQRGSVDGPPICGTMIQTLSSKKNLFQNDVVEPYSRPIF